MNRNRLNEIGSQYSMCMNTSSLQMGDFFKLVLRKLGEHSKWPLKHISLRSLCIHHISACLCRPTVLLRCSTLLLCICCCCVMRSKSKVLPWTCKGNGEERKEKRARVLGPFLHPHSFRVCTSSCNKELIILFQQPFCLFFPNQCKGHVPSSEDLAPQKIYSLAGSESDHQSLPLT